MRVISGSARRLLLKTVEGTDTRPTTDRIKETLFNMLQPELYDKSFLDLFSGSGAIGIEALSRGARAAVFVESDSRCAACIRDNLTTTHLEEGATLLNCDVMAGLRKLEEREEAFDFIFMDPPYNQLYEKAVLTYLASSGLADQDTLIIAEASKETKTDYLQELGYTLLKSKEYKTNKHLFIKKGDH